MYKKIISIFTTMTMVVSLVAPMLVIMPAVALADTPNVVIDPIGPLNFDLFPQTYNITGNLNHSPNIQSISELKLFINDVQEGETQNPGNTEQSATFSLPWNIIGPGNYTVTVTAKHGNNTGKDSGVR